MAVCLSRSLDPYDTCSTLELLAIEGYESLIELPCQTYIDRIRAPHARIGRDAGRPLSPIKGQGKKLDVSSLYELTNNTIRERHGAGKPTNSSRHLYYQEIRSNQPRALAQAGLIPSKTRLVLPVSLV